MTEAEPSPQPHEEPPAASTAQGRADREKLAAHAFERTLMPMLMTDPRQADYPIVLANNAFLKMSGYSAEEVLGRNPRFMQGEGSSRAAIAQIRAAIEEERDSRVEILNYRKDGSEIWLQVHTSPIRDDNGQVIYYFGSQIDVTELRRVQSLEATEHRLRMEVDHRARNVLATVNSIVRLTRSEQPAQYADAVQRRVQALADAHSLLANHRWGPVSLRQIIQQQVAPYGLKRTHFEGDETDIPPSFVQSLAVIFHELATNAALHGALSTPAGRLDIRWRRDADGAFDLRWQEHGGPQAPSEQARGFGSTIITGLVRHDLAGALDWSWQAEGLSLGLKVPALREGASTGGGQA